MEKIKRILVSVDFLKTSREGLGGSEPLWQSLKLREA